MTWKRSLGSKIFLALHQSASEELRPKPIHRDTRSQRILRVDYPIAQRETIDFPCGG
jgi:hypothetical protein